MPLCSYNSSIGKHPPYEKDHDGKGNGYCPIDPKIRRNTHATMGILIQEYTHAHDGLSIHQKCMTQIVTTE